MQLLAKNKNILYMGFRATLNFRKFNEALFQYIFSGYRPALQGGRPALPDSPRYPTQAINYRESRSCTDYCCLACDSEYEWYMLEGKGKNL